MLGFLSMRTVAMTFLNGRYSERRFRCAEEDLSYMVGSVVEM
jgi:hypothetical protein